MNKIKAKMIEKKEDEYMDYIDAHINDVKRVWNVAGLLLLENGFVDDFLFNDIVDLVNVHDASKYMYSEFAGYRQYFYPIEGEEKNELLFKHSWHRHIKDNKHHWNHWVVYDGKPEPVSMPLKYIIEMLCDWSAMSLKFNNIPSEWYDKNKFKMLMTQDTERHILQMLDTFDNVVKQLSDCQ